MKIKEKKAELTTQQIVMLIILIVSFVIILFLLFRLNLGGESKKELCRNSVVLKGKSAISGSTSLNCQRTYKCINQDGSCEKIIKPEIAKVKTLNDTYKELANEMADCWWVFGEGKIDYVGKDLLQNNYCSICSQIVFDDSLKDIKGINDGKISKDGLYEYLAKTKMPRKDITYTQYLFGTNNIEALKQEALQKSGTGKFGEIIIAQKPYLIVMGITNEVGTIPWVVAAGIGTVAGIAIAINPIGWVGIGTVIVVSSIGGSAAGATYAEGVEPEIDAIVMKGDGINNNFMRPTIVEADSGRFQVLNCKDVSTLS